MTQVLDTHVEELLLKAGWHPKNWDELSAKPIELFSKRPWLRQPNLEGLEGSNLREFPEPRGFFSYDHSGREHPFRVPSSRSYDKHVTELRCLLELYCLLRKWTYSGSVLENNFKLISVSMKSYQDYAVLWSMGEYVDGLVLALPIDWPICTSSSWSLDYKEQRGWRSSVFLNADLNVIDGSHPVGLGKGKTRRDFYESDLHLTPSKDMTTVEVTHPEQSVSAATLALAASESVHGQGAETRDWNKALVVGGAVALIAVVGLIIWRLLAKHTFWADVVGDWLGKLPVVGPTLEDFLGKISKKARITHYPEGRDMESVWFALRSGAKIRVPKSERLWKPDWLWCGRNINCRIKEYLISLVRVRDYENLGMSQVECVARHAVTGERLWFNYVEVVDGVDNGS